jgi:hypothetical protein
LGLDHPGHIAPTVIMPFVAPYVIPAPRAYFPYTGRQPPYGRLEIIPPDRRGPQTGAPYFRTWGTESMPTPATSPLPDNPPMVIVAPPAGSERRPHGPLAPRPVPPPKSP